MYGEKVVKGSVVQLQNDRGGQDSPHTLIEGRIGGKVKMPP